MEYISQCHKCTGKYKKKITVPGFIHNKRRGRLMCGKVLYHDYECLHTASRTPALLEHFSWALFDHPPFRTALAPTDYRPFICTCLKNCFSPQVFCKNGLMVGIKAKPSSKGQTSLIVAQKRTPRYVRSLNSSDNYVKYVRIFLHNFLSLLC
jgi:hypothetical protein